ncbi:MAG: DUF4105 domain-containing protein [Bacteriovorax sp.]|nr:DUF4105 domain-containing protein [Bacteriovorax sp.]
MKTITAVLSLIFAQSLLAHDLPIKLSSNLDSSKKIILERVLGEVSLLLPAKLKAGLPAGIELSIEKLSDHQKIPIDICSEKIEKVDKNKKIIRPFVYGEYNQNKNLLVINAPVFQELAHGRAASLIINCQHKSLYDQAISTIVHELAHAYDFNNQYISNKSEFIRRAGFKKGLLKVKTKNIEAMRSADPYELVNIAEAYAVNMEYFTMDPEYACRKPAMFDYYKRSLEIDPFPNRNCNLNNMVMMSTSAGFYPMKLDTKRVYRIDYLMASAGAEMSSGFGHSMFRIVMCAPDRFDPITNKNIAATPFGPKCIEDRLFHMVVSYRANVEDATLNYFKGMFGGYPSMLFILNFGDVLDEYNRDELRDVISYPLVLNTREKEDFINKVIEEHWNYRGSYKFFTNNCAVESYDLLKGALDRSQLQGFSSLSPKGVLEDLDKHEFLSLKNDSQESFKARTEQLILAFREAFGYKLKDGKIDKKELVKFIADSSADERLSIFNKFSKTKIETLDLHTEMSLKKIRLIKASSFSVMEQQILRSKTSEFRKKAADLFMNSKDEKVKKLLIESSSALKQNFTELTLAGYGVPLFDEMVSRHDIEEKVEQSKEKMANLEAALKEMMPVELGMLDAINVNIGTFNQKSLGIRKEYREKLEVYIHQVLVNLSNEDEGRTLLKNSLNSKESLNKVRDLLDKNLVSDKEMLDVKLRKLIEEILA